MDRRILIDSGLKFLFLFERNGLHFGSREVFKQEIESVCCMLLSGKLAVLEQKIPAGVDASGFETMDGDFTYELFLAQIESMIERVRS